MEQPYINIIEQSPTSFLPNIYNVYNVYNVYMTSTIRLSHEVKEKISTFGLKGESSEEIINRLYDLAVKERVREFLMPSSKYVSLEEFRKEVEKKWPKSK
jgi:predicted CopG family antitoxin